MTFSVVVCGKLFRLSSSSERSLEAHCEVVVASGHIYLVVDVVGCSMAPAYYYDIYAAYYDNCYLAEEVARVESVLNQTWKTI